MKKEIIYIKNTEGFNVPLVVTKPSPKQGDWERWSGNRSIKLSKDQIDFVEEMLKRKIATAKKEEENKFRKILNSGKTLYTMGRKEGYEEGVKEVKFIKCEDWVNHRQKAYNEVVKEIEKLPTGLFDSTPYKEMLIEKLIKRAKLQSK